MHGFGAIVCRLLKRMQLQNRRLTVQLCKKSAVFVLRFRPFIAVATLSQRSLNEISMRRRAGRALPPMRCPVVEIDYSSEY